jgi:hypothetical protein
MPPAVNSDPKQRARYQPIYETDPRTGRVVEIFYADQVLTGMKRAGWFWWLCKPRCPPEWPPIGPFGTSYRAYCDALRGSERLDNFVLSRVHRRPPLSIGSTAKPLSATLNADTVRTQQFCGI